jgi:hypothetical protein
VANGQNIHPSPHTLTCPPVHSKKSALDICADLLYLQYFNANNPKCHFSCNDGIFSVENVKSKHVKTTLVFGQP